MTQPTEPIHWAPHERPSMPGSPSTPLHSVPTRWAFAAVAVLLGLTGGLGSALLSANLANIQGHLGLTPSQGAWLSAAYLMVNLSANLVLIKFRQQYGLRRFAEIGLGLYALVTILHVLVEDYPMALALRGASGLAGATVSTLATMYMLQAFPKAQVGRALVIGMGISQLATPLAWLMSPTLLDLGEWHRLYVFEGGLALCSLASVVLLRLPPGDQIKAFARMDFLTIALFAPAIALITSAWSQGRLQWWTEQAWIGLAFALGLVLLLMAVLIEHHRANPLLQTRWLIKAQTLRFALGALTLRFLLSEQTYGAVGLLQQLGMGPDQLKPLYAVLLVSLIAGIGISAWTFNSRTLVAQILLSAALIGIGSWMDLDATSLTRPHDMFVSQGLVAFASGMFMGPLMMIGAQEALKNGPSYIISFSVLFAMTQSLGGLAGPAVLGTFETIQEKRDSAYLTEQMTPTRPEVSKRLEMNAQAYASRQTDPALRQALGASQLSQLVTRESHVLAYNDVFKLTAGLSFVFLAWSLFHVLRIRHNATREARISKKRTATL